jgi:hypothetical protein
MQDLELYYTETDKEVMALVAWHEKHIAERHRQGMEDKGDEGIKALLEKVKTIVHSKAELRREYERQDKEQEAEEMERRTLVHCETCNEMRRVEIIGEGIDEKHGWRGDQLQCTVCKTVFFAEIPNNWKDRLEYYKWLSDVMKDLVKRDDISQSKKEEGEAIFAALHNAYLKFAAAQKTVEEEEQKRELAEKEYEKQVENIRNELLLAKVNQAAWNSRSAGEA